MNALIAVLINKKTILVANEGRLLKKCFLGFLILMLAFQPNALGDIVRGSLVDAYLQVSVFVGFTLFIFLGLDYLTNFNIDSFLKKSEKLHVPISSFLGALPGCGGAIIVVTQYIQGKLSFGSLVAVLTATMGDAAFLLLSKEPIRGVQIFIITSIVGIISGYVVDLFHEKKYLIEKNNLSIEFEKIKSTFVSKFNIFWLSIFVPGFIIGLLTAFQVNLDKYSLISHFNLVVLIGSVGAILSIFMWSLNPLSDFQCSTEKSRSLFSRVIDTTNFVTTWVICGFLFYELFIFFTGINLKILFDIWLPLVPLVAIILGFVPGCGPQIVVTTFYLNGFIPFSAEIGNAISNDGDALFPAIALAPKAAIIATVYSAIPAIIVSYSYMLLFE
ncbi:MAG: hypothetical protein CFH30_00575 [Alphaproteobacteria bacterium MarineAlpha8_Bin1]|nr:MAG: hypothetical protein CFH30_00575 [Alphaproteobacteria bacterium MarineAlpha8_Bin1]